MKVIFDWIDDEIEKLAAEDVSAFERAGRLSASAARDGYSPNELLEACGGDIGAYLASRAIVSCHSLPIDGDGVSTPVP